MANPNQDSEKGSKDKKPDSNFSPHKRNENRQDLEASVDWGLDEKTEFESENQDSLKKNEEESSSGGQPKQQNRPGQNDRDKKTKQPR